ncbi:MAG: DUF6364 family protein [Chitinophagaceae bacterium]
MTTKLSLTIDDNTAMQIKDYAAKKKTSVSRIAEEYFNSLLEKNKERSFVEKYAGILKDIKIDDIDKARDEYLKEKYGL